MSYGLRYETRCPECGLIVRYRMDDEFHLAAVRLTMTHREYHSTMTVAMETLGAVESEWMVWEVALRKVTRQVLGTVGCDRGGFE